VSLLGRVRRRRGTPGSPRAERFLAAGARQSRAFGHDYVGTEHVLLALIEDPSTPAAQVLGRLGLTGDVVRRDIDEDALERAGGACRCVAPAPQEGARAHGDGVRRRPGALRARARPLSAVEDCIAARILADHGVTLTALARSLDIDREGLRERLLVDRPLLVDALSGLDEAALLSPSTARLPVRARQSGRTTTDRRFSDPFTGRRRRWEPE
jgi:ATP-dependent Clp protease ATP-binding subunit ClpA